MNWLQSLLYGFISGLTEFLPISSRAHQDVLLSLFGHTQHDPVRDFVIHITVIFALIYACNDLFSQFKRDRKIRNSNVQTRHNTQNAFVAQLIRSATLPMVIGLIVVSYVYKGSLNLLTSSLFLLINGIILYIPCRMLQGNKDASSMSALDAWSIGLGGALSVISGISRIGCFTSVSTVRGADRRKALNWALILSVPALVTLSCLDVFSLFYYHDQVSFWGNIFGYLLSIVGAFIGGYLSVIAIRFVTKRANYTGFAYYSWGLSLFMFVMYLLIV